MTNLEISEAFKNVHFIHFVAPTSASIGVIKFVFNNEQYAKKALTAYNQLYKIAQESRLHLEVTVMKSNVLLRLKIDKEILFLIPVQAVEAKEFLEAMENFSELTLAIYELDSEVSILDTNKPPQNKKNIIISSYSLKS